MDMSSEPTINFQVDIKVFRGGFKKKQSKTFAHHLVLGKGPAKGAWAFEVWRKMVDGGWIGELVF